MKPEDLNTLSEHHPARKALDLLRMGLDPNKTLSCFWPSGCSDRFRCVEYGSCVAQAQHADLRLRLEKATGVPVEVVKDLTGPAFMKMPEHLVLDAKDRYIERRFNAWNDPRRPKRPGTRVLSISPNYRLVLANSLSEIKVAPGMTFKVNDNGTISIYPAKVGLPLYTDDEGFLHPLGLIDDGPRQLEAHYKAVRQIEQN